MRKADIAVEVADRAALTKAQAKNAVNSVFEVIGDALANGDMVSVTGFGRFSTKNLPGRTGETAAIAASKTPSFKAAKALRGRQMKSAGFGELERVSLNDMFLAALVPLHTLERGHVTLPPVGCTPPHYRNCIPLRYP